MTLISLSTSKNPEELFPSLSHSGSILTVLSYFPQDKLSVNMKKTFLLYVCFVHDKVKVNNSHRRNHILKNK